MGTKGKRRKGGGKERIGSAPRRNPLLLLFLLLGLCSVEHFAEILDAKAKARMEVRLRALDHHVEVVAEDLDLGDGRGEVLRGVVTWEEDCRGEEGRKGGKVRQRRSVDGRGGKGRE